VGEVVVSGGGEKAGRYRIRKGVSSRRPGSTTPLVGRVEGCLSTQRLLLWWEGEGVEEEEQEQEREKREREEDVGSSGNSNGPSETG